MNKRQFLFSMGLAVVLIAFAGGINMAFAGPGTRAGTDASATPSGGTFYANSPAGSWNYTSAEGIANPVSSNSGTSLRKFVDSLPGVGPSHKNNLGYYIPIASKATVTVSGVGADYYEIGLRDYTQKMHTDLPKATRLRGYMDLSTAGGATRPWYLGPLIIAEKDRPVVIKFTNELGAAGGAGDLFIPVDHTYMGAGFGPDGIHSYTENRATLHLHGGHTPWISDGTPHQWIVPALDSGLTYTEGVSKHNVPGLADPGAGSATFYWTNNQSGRLMFYHDHAYGITRLNVYAGEAAGYLIVDPTEENLINTNVIPGSAMDPEYRYGIPLVIQDKTFVPKDVAVQDANWTNGKWGTYGDLWFPHVYETNQWPDAPDESGANNFGRWDFGPWFFPPQDSSTLVSADVMTWPVSGVPEGFMDTPIVNGTAYPYLTVDPQPYRFRILNACNDRMLNLSLFAADTSAYHTVEQDYTEVKMVEAYPRPACSASVTTNCVCTGSFTPTGCFPKTWPTDGRDGGVPDPAAMGPSFIQIGSESGLLPQATVIAPQPVGYEYNRRSIVVLNVSDKALFMGPAERADVIVDFSQFAGQTVILYNDAPAPVPAFDPRNDYYTNDPDNTWQGGAASTAPGYGPNTRTIMQFRVNPGTPAPFTAEMMSALTATMPVAFAASQPEPVVAEAIYGPAYGQSFTNKYSRIQDNYITFTNIATGATMTMHMLDKTIQELFTLDYGRMNATLGTELPFTNFLTQTTIPLGYIDPATEYMQNGKPQIWKITHNGVDTHAIHFHLFDVQLINRVGWDGMIRPPDANELGWKDTVRMHPLEDVFVALRPTTPPVSFTVPNSIRALDPTMPLGTTTQFTGVDPYTNNPITVTNEITNFGWEYVWHCHLLGHEENDMMRPVVFLPKEPILWFNTTSGQTWDMMTGGTLATTNGSYVYTEADPAHWSIVGKGDFDGDGINDYVWWNNTTGEVRIMFMDGATSVRSQTIVWKEPNTSWRIVATGDLNGDGMTDLIWWNSADGQVYGMLMNGSSTPTSAFMWAEPDVAHWRIVATGDLNGDGKADLIWWNSSTGQVFGMLMDGLKVTSTGGIWIEPHVNSWRIVGAGDINGDGKADLIWRNRISGQVFGMLLDGLNVTSTGSIWIEPNINWEIVSIDNYTTDFKADLLWRNKVTGTAFLLPLNGLSAASGAGVLWNEPKTTWRIEGTTEWRNNVYGVGVTTP